MKRTGPGPESAEKTGYAFHRILPARPPFPRDGHLHIRRAGAPV
ncbi:hypothetical protein [Streptomyces paludis]